MSVRCFWIEPTGDAEVEFHDKPSAIVPYEARARQKPQFEGWKSISPRYRRPDTGEIRTAISAFGPGAMWDAWWLNDLQPTPNSPFFGPGRDGRTLCVTLPDGSDWVIDSRASNCTMPADTAHRCWVRHGEPPNVTVDKDGPTCAAGSGSIQTGRYHGFLRNGELT